MLGGGRDSTGGEGTGAVAVEAGGTTGGGDAQRGAVLACTERHNEEGGEEAGAGSDEVVWGVAADRDGTVSPGVDISTTRSFTMHILLRLVSRVSALESGPNTS
jgi:hypothetical protein